MYKISVILCVENIVSEDTIIRSIKSVYFRLEKFVYRLDLQFIHYTVHVFLSNTFIIAVQRDYEKRENSVGITIDI